MLVCTGKQEIRIFYYSLHLFQIIAYYPVFLKYSTFKPPVLRTELVNLTHTETMGMFQSYPAKVSSSLEDLGRVLLWTQP